ncbi:hypothetical protein [Gramella sp. MAR_2010_147]|uniref:hypothetical protein n=1 Tax=Gramella sp. MAR_2010_147 TaxID=1250205 RepID=UPI00087A43E5|nr:hypothetical protein [Gramella sp. MAR_2010_147]SDR71639.1 hypothetical protein SAMN04488553_0415 [Gramella sp. MAR_2010_147]
MKFKQFLYTGAIIILLSGCGKHTRDSEIVIPKIPGIIEFQGKNDGKKAFIAGQYISEVSQDKEFYRKVINISFIGTEKILVKAHFYKKKKSAAYVFQKIFFKKSAQLYTGKIKGKTIFINFTKNELSIELKDSEISTAKCSRKNTLEGVYKKMDGLLHGI